MKTVLRVSALWESLKGALWLLPTVFVVVALALGQLVAEVEIPPNSRWQSVVFAGSASGARDVLSVIAGAMITVTGLVFSLTVVALQMASSQYSPRVLRGFLSDRGNQLVLSVLLASFAYSLAVIRVSRGSEGLGEPSVPRLAVTVGFVLSLVAVGALVYFLHHLTQQLRPETIMGEIASDTLSTIDKVHPAPLPDHPEEAELPIPNGGERAVKALRSGHLQAVDTRGLVKVAVKQDLVVRVRVPVGVHVAEGTTVAWVWPRDWAGGLPDDETLRPLVHDHIHFGGERTLQQDVAFGMRQLVDIAGRALSTGVNDPTTAVEALRRLSEIMCRLACRRLGSVVERDEDGYVRAVVPQPRFMDYLALVCDQPRRSGRSEPAVVLALLDLLADLAEIVGTEDQRQAVRVEIARTVEVAAGSLDDTDMVRVRSAADLVLETLTEGRQMVPEVEAG